MAKSQEDIQELETWGLGDLGTSQDAPGFRDPHRLLRAATAGTAAILCRVCSLTPSFPSPRVR